MIDECVLIAFGDGGSERGGRRERDRERVCVCVRRHRKREGARAREREREADEVDGGKERTTTFDSSSNMHPVCCCFQD
jgi:hypothetical protein